MIQIQSFNILKVPSVAIARPYVCVVRSLSQFGSASGLRDRVANGHIVHPSKLAASGSASVSNLCRHASSAEFQSLQGGQLGELRESFVGNRPRSVQLIEAPYPASFIMPSSRCLHREDPTTEVTESAQVLYAASVMSELLKERCSRPAFPDVQQSFIGDRRGAESKILSCFQPFNVRSQIP